MPNAGQGSLMGIDMNLINRQNDIEYEGYADDDDIRILDSLP